MNETPIKRRLATVLAADAVGYSRMMSEDEEGTLRVLAGHREIIDQIIASRDGRIFGTAGDSVLAEFESPVEAVRCAIEIQSALRTRNFKLPENRRMLFRIGINLGDVTIKEGDLLGDGVNVAARLEGIADPGGVCVSSAVYEQTLGKLTLGFTDLGEQALKNITRPVRAYTVYEGEPAVRSQARPRAAPSRLARAALAGVPLALLVAGLAWWLLRAGPAPVAPDPEQVLWEAVRDSDDPAVLAAYLDQYAGGAHSQLARLRLAKLQAGEQQQRELQDALQKARDEANLARAEADRENARILQAKLEDELRRARAEADRARKAVEADRQKLRELEQQQQRALDQQARAENAPPAVPTAPAQRYDGRWEIRFECEAYRDNPAFSGDIPAGISNGVLAIDRGNPGEKGYFRASGQVAANDEITISGERYSWKLGKAVPVHLAGKFQAGQLTGAGTFAKRPCTIAMTRSGG